MTVRILNAVEKTLVAHQYVHENAKVKNLAVDYKVSRRTINRVLVEMGVAPIRKPKAVPLYNVQAELPITMTEPSFIQKVKEFFKSIFAKKQYPSNVYPTK